MAKLGESVEKYGLLVHAYVLMDNHYHLLLETLLGNLSKAMHHLHASYSNWFHFKHQIAGSVFQGRFKSILVEKDEYLRVLSAYIHLNPVRAGIVVRPSMYPYSSAAYYGSHKKPPAFLRTNDLLGMFTDRNEYRRYLEGFRKVGIAANEIYGKNCLLGSEGFLRKVLAKRKRTCKVCSWSGSSPMPGALSGSGRMTSWRSWWRACASRKRRYGAGHTAM